MSPTGDSMRKDKKKAPQKNTVQKTQDKKQKKEFPKEFPFWGRMKMGKKRTALIIDEETVRSKKSGKTEDAFVHREATHTERKDYEKIFPNPDKTDDKPMYLKRPRKKPKRMFEPHNKNLDMPLHLKERYEKNNRK